MFAAGGSSSEPCLETFAGATAFSEVEARALADYFNTIANRVVFYFAVHSYSQYILIPYGYTATPIPEYNQYVRAILIPQNKLFGNVCNSIGISNNCSTTWPHVLPKH